MESLMIRFVWMVLFLNGSNTQSNLTIFSLHLVSLDYSLHLFRWGRLSGEHAQSSIYVGSWAIYLSYICQFSRMRIYEIELYYVGKAEEIGWACRHGFAGFFLLSYYYYVPPSPNTILRACANRVSHAHFLFLARFPFRSGVYRIVSFFFWDRAWMVNEGEGREAHVHVRFVSDLISMEYACRI
jgi:hypothetical protein